MFLCCDREGLMSVGEIYSRKSDWLMRESPNTNEMQKESVQKLEVFGKGKRGRQEVKMEENQEGNWRERA